jgi:hypothetical protein
MFNRLSRDDSSHPSWRVRRKFFAFTVCFAALMTVYVAFRWEDLSIARELIVMATALWLGVLGFYTTGATLEDINLYGKYKLYKGDNDEEGSAH